MNFFAEGSGKPSMTRLLAFILTLTTTMAVFQGRDAATVAALVGGGVVALMSRRRVDNRGTEDKPEARHGD